MWLAERSLCRYSVFQFVVDNFAFLFSAKSCYKVTPSGRDKFARNSKKKLLISFDPLDGFLNFKKAYNSIARVALIETLVHYKINTNLIQTIISMYGNDTTVVKL